MNRVTHTNSRNRRILVPQECSRFLHRFRSIARVQITENIIVCSHFQSIQIPVNAVIPPTDWNASNLSNEIIAGSLMIEYYLSIDGKGE